MDRVRVAVEGVPEELEVPLPFAVTGEGDPPQKVAFRPPFPANLTRPTPGVRRSAFGPAVSAHFPALLTRPTPDGRRPAFNPTFGPTFRRLPDTLNRGQSAPGSFLGAGDASS